MIECHKELLVEVIVLARGGGSREDLMVFDNEEVCRTLANSPLPVVTGLGHEDDLTVADLVADYRAATPTAAIVALLPNKQVALSQCLQLCQRLEDHCDWLIRKERQRLLERTNSLKEQTPRKLMQSKFKKLSQRKQLLMALSPDRWLAKGFAILRDEFGETLQSVEDVSLQQRLTIQLKDGRLTSIAETIHRERKVQ